MTWINGPRPGPVDLPVGQINEFAVQPPQEKYFCFSETQISDISVAIPSRKRGVGHRHERWGGMRWTQAALLTRVPDADGEVVWS